MKTVLVPLMAALLLAACTRAADAPPPPRAVYVLAVSPGNAGSETLQALVQSRTELELGFRVGGRVLERLVDAGARVRRGQPLARLVPTELRLGLQAAEAQLAAAAADAAQQQRDAERLGRLEGDGSVGAADAERQRTAARAAAERLQAARAQQALAAERLAHAELRAPFDAVVTATRAEPGLVLPEGAPALSLAAPGQLELQIDLPPTLAARAEALRFEALGRGWRLRELQPAAHPQTRTQRARFAPERPLPWAADLLGRSLVVQLPAAAPAAGLRLPASALLARDGQAQVWRVEQGRLRAQPVQLLARDGERVLVSGLQAGQQVVALGAPLLQAGQAVRVLPLERAP